MIHNKTKASSILPYTLIREMDSIGASSRAEMDVREDEEQENKCREVMELFLAAGYFRARITVFRFRSIIRNFRIFKINHSL